MDFLRYSTKTPLDVSRDKVGLRILSGTSASRLGSGVLDLGATFSFDFHFGELRAMNSLSRDSL